MCLNCGCGQLDTRHKETDLIRADIRRAAEGQGSSMDTTIANLERSMRELRSGAASASASGTKTGTAAGSAPR